MTASDLQDLIVKALTRESGQQHRWRMVIGKVRVYSLSTHPHCNWSITPMGSVSEVAKAERVLDTIRMRHPIVTGRLS